jgi:hypothetical protein
VAEPKRLVERAAKLSKVWATLSPAQTRSILRALIARVDVHTTKVDIHLVLAHLPDLLRGNPLNPPPAPEGAGDAERMTLSVPAHRLNEKLMSENLSIGDIAESEGLR